MTQDEIIEMARQAGFAEPERIISTDTVRCVPDLAYFAKLVALRYEKKIADLENIICQRYWNVLQEREACAKVCEDSVEYAGDTLANAIRARSKL